jgi:MarR family transcriptional regulator, transcriptional regulator for hemolysin
MHWHQHLGFLLDDVAHLYTRRFEERTQGVSLTRAQCKALAVLANCEGVNQKRLADISEIDPGRLVRILDRMGAVGWAERRSDPHDRRAHALAITESGRPVVQRIWHVVRETNSEALKGLATNELHLLTELLERVHANLLALEPLAAEPAYRGGAADAAAGA